MSDSYSLDNHPDHGDGFTIWYHDNPYRPSDVAACDHVHTVPLGGGTRQCLSCGAQAVTR